MNKLKLNEQRACLLDQAKQEISDTVIKQRLLRAVSKNYYVSVAIHPNTISSYLHCINQTIPDVMQPPFLPFRQTTQNRREFCCTYNSGPDDPSW